MKAFGYALAGIRALFLFAGMLVYILLYASSCIFIAHSKVRALRLRKHFLKYWCLPVLNIRIIKRGQPATFPALYVCNHRSFADPIALCRYLKAFVIAKAEVKHYPVINWGAELTGVIWVNRQDQESRSQARNTLVDTIKSGFNVLVFPEGTVGITPDTLPFKKGTFMEAAMHGIPVIPLAIEFRSRQDLWLVEKFIPQFLFQFSKFRTEVKISFGEPIYGHSGEHMHSQAFAWVNATLQEMQSGWSTAFDPA